MYNYINITKIVNNGRKNEKHIIKLKNINTSVHPDYVEIKDLEDFVQFMCIANENKYFTDIVDLSEDNIKNFCNILIDYYENSSLYNSSVMSLRMLSIKNSELGSTFDNESRKIAENYGIENLDIKFGSDKISTGKTVNVSRNPPDYLGVPWSLLAMNHLKLNSRFI